MGVAVGGGVGAGVVVNAGVGVNTGVGVRVEVGFGVGVVAVPPQAGRPEIRKTQISLLDLLNEVVNLYRDYKDLEIALAAPDTIPLLELDGEQFKRVFINIFDNAIQAMSNSGRIDVTVEFDELSESGHVAIADNGPGIQDQDKEKLFLPYSSTKKNGTGLGLAIKQDRF